MANRDPVLSLLAACHGKTCWNQSGRIKSQVHLPAWHSYKVCCLLSKRCGDGFNHIYIFTCDGTYLILHSPQKRILRQELELKYFEKWYQKWSWESGEVRRGWEAPSWRCVHLRVNTVAPGALSRWGRCVWLCGTHISTLHRWARPFVHPALVKDCCCDDELLAHLACPLKSQASSCGQRSFADGSTQVLLIYMSAPGDLGGTLTFFLSPIALHDVSTKSQGEAATDRNSILPLPSHPLPQSPTVAPPSVLAQSFFHPQDESKSERLGEQSCIPMHPHFHPAPCFSAPGGPSARSRALSFGSPSSSSPSPS